MRTIIAGSRGIKDIALVRAAVDLAGFEISEVFSGGAQGVDQLGESVAYSRHIQVRTFPADWDKHGLSAGPIRNLEMAAAADALIAVWDGESRGTKHMIETAVKVGLRVFVLGPGEGYCRRTIAGSGGWSRYINKPTAEDRDEAVDYRHSTKGVYRTSTVSDRTPCQSR